MRGHHVRFVNDNGTGCVEVDWRNAINGEGNVRWSVETRRIKGAIDGYAGT